ncbi:hypothetical protein [Spiroplasma endosymbiont of Polydrusus formosus]|uniref:hypothetical protein n=1 Tax=Spiroplasma endosymbiont of Polydrusus formosus TaxID=3139326 RepID=UPI0035B517F0
MRKKLYGVNEFKTNINYLNKQQNENKLAISINDIINHKVSDKKSELVKSCIIEEK